MLIMMFVYTTMLAFQWRDFYKCALLVNGALYVLRNKLVIWRVMLHVVNWDSQVKDYQSSVCVHFYRYLR